jgi:OmpA-OmpF porin, OOP family
MFVRCSILGAAENEVEWFRAISFATTVVDAARMIDQINVKENSIQSLSGYGLEILRSPKTISVVGLISGNAARDALMSKLRSLRSDETTVFGSAGKY